MTVPAGSIYGFVGPNGSGKTTTIDLILGMGQKDRGTITVLGRDHLQDEVAVKQRVGYVSTDLNFASWGVVWKLIRFVKGLYPTWDDARCARLLEVFALDLGDTIGTLSFGGRLKLALTLAMSFKPELLLLDEPAAGLDAISKQTVFGELLGAVADGATVVMSSHNLVDVERITDHIGMIRNGRMVMEGCTRHLVEVHRFVDFDWPAGAAFPTLPGVRLVQAVGLRHRALVNLRSTAISSIAAIGASSIQDSPVSLEEMFVVFGQG